MTRILITGATGFAGGHLVAQLLAEGHELYGLIRPEEVGQARPFTPLVGDLLDGASLEAAVRAAQPETIYHLAGLADVGASWRQPGLALAINAGGTANLLAAIVASGLRPRIVAVTSAEVYGPLPVDAMPLNGWSQPNPVHPYAISKVAASQLVQMYHARFGLDVVEARPFNHIGPGQLRGFVVPDFASQVAAIQQGTQPPRMVVGNLAAERDFTDARDVVRAYRLLAEKGQAGTHYLICSGKPVCVRHLLEMLIEMAGVTVEITADPERMRPSDTPCLYGSYDKLRHDTGWQPSIPLRQSLADVLVEWGGVVRSN